LVTTNDEAPPHDTSFHYRQIIGKLNYLEKSAKPNISYATHQCACFSADPKQPHADAVKWLGRYLKGTKDKRMILKPKEHHLTSTLMLILQATGTNQR